MSYFRSSKNATSTTVANRITISMKEKKRESTEGKAQLHPRNRHQERYDLKTLAVSNPLLEPYIMVNKYGAETIDFFNPEAVLQLNRALLKHYYDIEEWDIPEGYLCPPIPGRADYIHSIADLLAESNRGRAPKGNKICCLDVGVGANCIYPIIGVKEYGWSFVASEIDPVSASSAKSIVAQNSILKGKVDVRLQASPSKVFEGIINDDEMIDVTICNPPFHASKEEAQAATARKTRNLKGKHSAKAVLNFGGQSNELWCTGGEIKLIFAMIEESKELAKRCMWFTTLVSKQSNLGMIYKRLDIAGAMEVKTIEMGQGNKQSRIVAWSYFTIEQRKKWAHIKWSTVG